MLSLKLRVPRSGGGTPPLKPACADVPLAESPRSIWQWHCACRIPHANVPHALCQVHSGHKRSPGSKDTVLKWTPREHRPKATIPAILGIHSAFCLDPLSLLRAMLLLASEYPRLTTWALIYCPCRGGKAEDRDRAFPSRFGLGFRCAALAGCTPLFGFQVRGCGGGGRLRGVVATCWPGGRRCRRWSRIPSRRRTSRAG